MQGTVSDESGELLIGANVRAVHEPTGTAYGAVTNLEGRFFLPNLRPGGPYSVTISYVGYGTVKYTDINLNLGSPYSLKASMEEDASQLAEVVVKGSRSNL